MGAFSGTDGISGAARELLASGFAVQVGCAAAIVQAHKVHPRPLFVTGETHRGLGEAHGDRHSQ